MFLGITGVAKFRMNCSKEYWYDAAGVSVPARGLVLIDGSLLVSEKVIEYVVGFWWLAYSKRAASKM